MSYIAFELDALNVCPQVGAACGLTAAEAAHGLLQLWAWCFRAEQASVTATHIKGFFGGADAGPSLEAFGFLERAEDGWRVKGAERYLRVKEAQREGGRKGQKNLRRGSGKPGPQPGPQPEVDLKSTSGTTSSASPALTPSTEHRAPKTESTSSSPGDAFWNWAQGLREAAGCVRERPPETRTLSGWYSVALSELSGDDGRLREAWLRFGDDPYWQKATPACPFRAFMNAETGWRKYVPRQLTG